MIKRIAVLLPLVFLLGLTPRQVVTALVPKKVNIVDVQNVKLMLDARSGLTYDASNRVSSWCGYSRTEADHEENIILQSEAFDNGSWDRGTGKVSATPDQVTNPINGAQTADKLLPTATTGSHYIRQSVTISTGQTYTFSVYAKAAEESVLKVQYSMLGGTVCTLSGAGSVVNDGGVTGAITALNGGWYLCSATMTPGSAGGTFQIYLRTGASYDGTGQGGLYLFGAEVAHSWANPSYCPTTTAIKTGTQTASIGKICFTQSSDDLKPVVDRTTSLNGRPVIKFDGSNDTLSVSTFPPFSGVTGFSVFAALRPGAASQNGIYLLSANDFTRLMNPAGTDILIGPSGTVSAGNYYRNVNDANASVFSIIYDGTKAQSYDRIAVYRNGFFQSPIITSSTTPSITTTNNGIFNLGSYYYNGAGAWNGSMGAIVIVGNSASSPVRRLIEQQLRSEWGTP